ncbi:MAG: hypothetical protein VX764_10395 [Planctomycetota bacterium]|nr:hypothetical protein [Planctomycetota bacterium]
MRFFDSIQQWYRRWKLFQRARSILRGIFQQPERLQETSLKPSHFGRCDVVDVESEDTEIRSITFQILRHPRPHPFSRQYHLVAERWKISLPDGRPERCGSVNLSRLRGRDGEPPGSFP